VSAIDNATLELSTLGWSRAEASGFVAKNTVKILCATTLKSNFCNEVPWYFNCFCNAMQVIPPVVSGRKCFFSPEHGLLASMYMHRKWVKENYTENLASRN
jgi:hypothetical protein